MNVLKTILDFILSVTRLFFRGKSPKRQFCAKCGALLRANSPCGCGGQSAGSGTGRSGSGDDSSPENEEPESDSETEEDPLEEDDEPPSETLNATSVAGWCLF